MTGRLQAARSALSFLVVLGWMMGIGAPILYLFVLPLGALLEGAQRRRLTSLYMKLVCWGILSGFRLGGARFERRGTIPTAAPSIILMNHQSLLDIVTTTMMGSPYVPAFVPRRRYARWYIPLVGGSIWLLECPVVDPKRDAKGAVEAMRRAALDHDHGLLIFPEGHRSVDGQVRPFKTAGTLAALTARRLPVYLVVSDGYWFGRRFVDFFWSVPRIRGMTEVLGPFAPPEGEEALVPFIESMRGRIVERLEERRGTRSHGIA
jgi:1-acyl-sn-glycerol-3-phosphate acyltransferase